jgi:hypothetical protein
VRQNELPQKPHKLGLLGQESVVTGRAGHLPVFGINSGRADQFREFANRTRWEEPIGADTHERETSAYTPEYLLRRSTPSEWILGIHRARDSKIRIGVEALDKPLTLVIEVTGDIKPAPDQAAPFVT